MLNNKFWVFSQFSTENIFDQVVRPYRFYCTLYWRKTKTMS